MPSLILSIETSTKACSVALAENGNLISFLESVDFNYSHSEKLNLFIKDVFEKGDRKMNQLSAVSVSKGPGSFTGLRIGVSTAKGLAYALDIPLLAIETPKSMALGFVNENPIETNGLLIPMIDARRREVYMQMFNANLIHLCPTKALAVDRDSFLNYEQYGKIHLFGDGADKFEELFKEDSQIIVHENFYPSARFMIRPSLIALKNREFEDIAYFEPYYLKDFIAIKPRNLF